MSRHEAQNMRQLQQSIDAWISQFEEGYFPIFEQLARLVEETGELARVLSHRFGHKIPKNGEDAGDLVSEVGDLLFVLACLCNACDIDMTEALEKTLEKVRERDTKRWTPKIADTSRKD